MTQTGARKALHQAVQIGDQRTAQTAAIGLHFHQGLTDATSQLSVLGLFETLGETQQTLVGFAEFFQVRGRPFALLQALPYLQDLTCLMDDALGEMVLEAVSARIFCFGHVLTTSRGNPDKNAGAMLALLFARKCVASHFVVIFQGILRQVSALSSRMRAKSCGENNCAFDPGCSGITLDGLSFSLIARSFAIVFLGSHKCRV